MAFHKHNIPYEKVGKNAPVSIADEVPFEIPDSWEWVRLGTVFEHCTGKALNQTNKEGKLLDYITTSNLYWNHFELDSVKQMYFKESEIDKCTATKGDLLICEGGDIGRAAIWNYDYDIRIQNHIHKLRAYINVCTEYFYYLFHLYKGAGWIGGKGIGIQGLSSNALHNILFPLPPVAEQYRIVEKIKEIKPFTDKYEIVGDKLNTLNDGFPDQLKKSILQEAVMGKLVPQDPNDESASVLLEKIRAEKQRLIAEGKLKKDKHESIIYRRDNSHYEKINGKDICIDEDIPFEIPENWCWERWGNISQSIQYGFNAPAKEIGRIRMVRISDIQNNRVLWDAVPFCDIDENDIDTYLLEKNDILFARTGGTVGKSYLVQDVPIQSVYAGYLIRTRYSDMLCPQYLKYFMESELYWRQLKAGTTVTAQPNCNGKTLGNMLIPIPPLAEQERIVNQIQSLFESVAAL